MPSRTGRLAALLSAVVILCTGAAQAAAAEPDYAPVERPGPALSVPAAKLREALRCTPGLRGADREPVLLIHGTFIDSKTNFSWNYERAFAAADRPYCAVELPDRALADIQVSAEYVVHALRAMRAASGHPVDVVGFSQGGMIGRWALRFWPDTRPMVDDLIGIDPSNNGTLDAVAVCLPGCAPAVHQQRTGSKFLRALNSPQETFAGIDYTQVYTPLDEVVLPNIDPVASSALRTGDGAISNISTLRVCPVHVAEHLSMGTIDPVAYAVVIDALEHDGPADPRRIDRAVCTALVHPGVRPAEVPLKLTEVGLTIVDSLLSVPFVAREPELKSYVYA